MRTGEPKIVGIVLAAGVSSRMGRVKALLPWGDTCLLDRVIDNASGSKLDGLIVVLGHEAERIREHVDLNGMNVVVNHNYHAGQSTSLHAGLCAVSGDVDGVLFLLGDQPFIDDTVIDRLIDAYTNRQSGFVVPLYRGQRGNPVLVDRSMFDAVKRITGDRGARCLFTAMSHQLQEIELSAPAILVDIDTMEDYRECLSLSGSPRTIF